MSAAVCGKRAVFQEYPSPTSSSKRGRYVARLSPTPLLISTEDNPPFLSPPASADRQSEPLSRLREQFPGLDSIILQDAYDASGQNLQVAAQRIVERIRSEDLSQHRSGQEWVELVVREMMSSADIEDAKEKASRVLEAFEKALKDTMEPSSSVVDKWQKEIGTLKEQVSKLTYENGILRRAVTIHHSRQQEYEERGREMEKLKQVLAQYQEQVKSLEMANYALSVHLKTAQQDSPFGRRFPPDVY